MLKDGENLKKIGDNNKLKKILNSNLFIKR